MSNHSYNPTRAAALLICVLGVLLGVPAHAAEAEPMPFDTPVGHGCYVPIPTWGGDIAHWRAHVKLMKRAGMNTFSIYYASIDMLTDLIDIAIEEGMLETSIPVVAHSVGMGYDKFKHLVTDEEEAREPLHPVMWPEFGEAYVERAMREEAKRRSKYADQWPELIAYGVDEPGSRAKRREDASLSRPGYAGKEVKWLR